MNNKKTDRRQLGKSAYKKGKRTERNFIKFLKKIFPEYNFKRTPSSGAWDKDNKYGLNGDVVCDVSYFPFWFEVKSRGEYYNLSKLLSSKTSTQIIKWYNKAKEKSLKLTHKTLIPILAIKLDYKPWLLILNLDDILFFMNPHDFLRKVNHCIIFNNIENSMKLVAITEDSAKILAELLNNMYKGFATAY